MSSQGMSLNNDYINHVDVLLFATPCQRIPGLGAYEMGKWVFTMRREDLQSLSWSGAILCNNTWHQEGLAFSGETHK